MSLKEVPMNCTVFFKTDENKTLLKDVWKEYQCYFEQHGWF